MMARKKVVSKAVPAREDEPRVEEAPANDETVPETDDWMAPSAEYTYGFIHHG